MIFYLVKWRTKVKKHKEKDMLEPATIGLPTPPSPSSLSNHPTTQRLKLTTVHNMILVQVQVPVHGINISSTIFIELATARPTPATEHSIGPSVRT